MTDPQCPYCKEGSKILEKLVSTGLLQVNFILFPFTFVIFDILYLNAEKCLLDLPLCRHKELIEAVIEKTPSLILSHPFPEKGTVLFKEDCRHQLECIVAKGGR